MSNSVPDASYIHDIIRSFYRVQRTRRARATHHLRGRMIIDGIENTVTIKADRIGDTLIIMRLMTADLATYRVERRCRIVNQRLGIRMETIATSQRDVYRVVRWYQDRQPTDPEIVSAAMLLK